MRESRGGRQLVEVSWAWRRFFCGVFAVLESFAPRFIAVGETVPIVVDAIGAQIFGVFGLLGFNARFIEELLRCFVFWGFCV